MSTQQSDPYHTATRKQLHERGYVILPAERKVVASAGWNKPLHPRSVLGDYRKWPERLPERMSTAVRVEGGMVVLDNDVDDAVSDAIWLVIARVMGNAIDVAPLRYGASAHKFALFFRFAGAGAFSRLATNRYCKPGETKSQCVEIFGSQPGGRCNKYFVVCGPHSDGFDYVFAGGPALWDQTLAELPEITRAQVDQIRIGVEQALEQAGWVREVAEIEGTQNVVFDITEATRFDVHNGPDQVDYVELCALFSSGADLRVAASFIGPHRGNERSHCKAFWSYRYDCLGIYVFGDEASHYPADAAQQRVPEGLGERLKAAAEAAGVEMAPPVPNWRERYATSFPKASLHNARLAIEAVGVVCREDTFHGRITMASARKLPFLGEVGDAQIASLRSHLSLAYGFDLTEKHIRDAVVMLAYEGRFDPVVDMLAEAQAGWDGVARLDRMAVDYFNAEDTTLNRACVRKTLIAAVRRARWPGCKFDTILVMESAEGWNKSSAWAVLAGADNFSDEPIIGKGTREVQEALARVWVHENAELAGMRKAEVETVKSFASRQVDRARPAYGHFMVAQPRHSIEVATTNADAYLLSQTGNRRFWPLRVTKPIDLTQLAADRAQLWGEAAHCEAAGEPLTLDEALWAVAGVEQERRRVKDPWEDALRSMKPVHGVEHGVSVIHRADGADRVATASIFECVLKMPAGQLHAGHWRRLADVMRHLGWSNCQFWHNDTAVRGYSRGLPDDLPPEGGRQADVLPFKK